MDAAHFCQLGKPDLSHMVTGSKQCLVTVCLGGGAEGVERLAIPLMRAYARAIGCDFGVITDLGMDNRYQHPKYAIMQLNEWFRHYDRICYADADTFWRPSAGNVFEAHPPCHFYAHNEGLEKGDAWAQPYHERICQEARHHIPMPASISTAVSRLQTKSTPACMPCRRGTSRTGSTAGSSGAS